MLRDRIQLGVWIGLVAAAATAGALIGFGAARGTPIQPLNTVAHILLGSRAYYVTGWHPFVTTVGILSHVASVLVWGVMFAIVLARARGLALWTGALVMAAVIAAIDFKILPDRLSPGFETMLSRTEVAVTYGVLAISLAVATIVIRARGLARSQSLTL